MSISTIQLLTDEPIEQAEGDGLGFDTYARVLAGAAIGTAGPFTIGVFGEWGTGKTSLMRMVNGRLDDQENADLVTAWLTP